MSSISNPSPEMLMELTREAITGGQIQADVAVTVLASRLPGGGFNMHCMTSNMTKADLHALLSGIVLQIESGGS